MDVWTKASREGNETYPNIGATDPDMAIFGGYQMGIIRIERNKIDGHYNLFSAMSGSPTWSTFFNLTQIEYCVGDSEGYEDLITISFELNMPAVSVFSCFRYTSNFTRAAEIDQLGT